MEYTAGKLAKISGVSIRTLHWYDEIGLLEPSMVKSNGYRYYGEVELLKLQQILFFRKLGLSLKEIEKVVLGSDFDHLKALAAHRAELKKKMEESEALIETINNTIKHIKGKIVMKGEDLYYGFDSEEQKKYAKELEQSDDPEMIEGIAESKERTKNMSVADHKAHMAKSLLFYKKFAKIADTGCKAVSQEIQDLMPEFKEWLEAYYCVPRSRMIGLGEFYRSHAGFNKFFEKQGVDMDFFIEAMNVYANSKLV